jgi:hypothetical protein
MFIDELRAEWHVVIYFRISPYLLSKALRLKYMKLYFCCCFIWAWNLISASEIEDVCEQIALKGRFNRGIEKIT